MEIIVGKTAGFCYGVNRAVEGSKKILKESKEGNIYCLGEIVHNKTVVDELKKEGIKFINKIEEAKGTTIIRAHGVPKEIYKEAENKKIKSEEIYNNILSDYEELLNKTIEIKEKSENEKEYSTSSLIDDYIKEYGKIIWMLKSVKS